MIIAVLQPYQVNSDKLLSQQQQEMCFCPIIFGTDVNQAQSNISVILSLILRTSRLRFIATLICALNTQSNMQN